MAKKSQLIFAKGKAQALDSLFIGDNPPFGYLAIGYTDSSTNGFEDPIDNETLETDEEYGGFKEIEPITYKYSRIKLTSADDANFQNIDYNSATGKVTRTYQATLDSSNIENTYINQIAVVNTSEARDNKTNYYSATTFSSFYKDSQSSITFKISFTI